ncbi:MAG: GNAT family N-acetyltransferase [Eggerthellaceae bacterium]
MKIGQFNGVQTFDFIYRRDINDSTLTKCFQTLFSFAGSNLISVSQLPVSSVSYHVLKTIGVVVDEHISKNVRIDFEKDYESYFSSLGKHTRQNIRTAYNRLKTDGVQYRLEVVSGETVDKKTYQKAIELYCKRHEERYGVSTPAMKRWYLKHLDFSTKVLSKSHLGFNGFLYIDGQLAAFLSGLRDDNEHSVVVPRLSINNYFSRYSPGMILINEVVKYCCECDKIRTLDLSKGDESYKLAAGGTVYETASMSVAQMAYSEASRLAIE